MCICIWLFDIFVYLCICTRPSCLYILCSKHIPIKQSLPCTSFRNPSPFKIQFLKSKKYTFSSWKKPKCFGILVPVSYATDVQWLPHRIKCIGYGLLALGQSTTVTNWWWWCMREDRVAKCHRYGRYICVKILEGWGKKWRRPRSFLKWSIFCVNSTNFYEVCL